MRRRKHEADHNIDRKQRWRECIKWAGGFANADGERMMRSHKVIAMSVANAKEDALNWLRQFLGKSLASVLTVAGPRESKTPGIQARAKAFLEELLWEA